MTAKQTIEAGKAILGIEFGSTRIKAVLIDEDNKPIAQGSHEWENQLVDGLWPPPLSPFSPPDLDRRVDSPALSGRGSRPSGRTSG